MHLCTHARRDAGSMDRGILGFQEQNEAWELIVDCPLLQINSLGFLSALLLSNQS